MCRSKYKTKSLTGFSICSSVLLRDGGVSIKSININLTYDTINQISFIMSLVLMLIIARISIYIKGNNTKNMTEKLKKE